MNRIGRASQQQTFVQSDGVTLGHIFVGRTREPCRYLIIKRSDGAEEFCSFKAEDHPMLDADQ